MSSLKLLSLVLFFGFYDPGSKKDDYCPGQKNIGKQHRNAQYGLLFAEKVENGKVEREYGEEKDSQQLKRFVICHSEPVLPAMQAVSAKKAIIDVVARGRIKNAGSM